MKLVDRFAAEAEGAGSTVHRMGAWSDVARLAEKLAKGGKVCVTPALTDAEPELVAALGARMLHAEDGRPGAVADAAVGIMACPLAVAETGSVLSVEHPVPDRLVSMLAVTLVQVVREGDVVSSLDDVAAWLSRHARGPAYAALVTGPSRTADIERSLTIGVQGPAETHVVVLGGET